MKLQIIPKDNPVIKKCIEHIKTIDQSFFENGPVQIYFPRIFNENVNSLKSKLNKYPFPTKIYFAHKAIKSKTFVKEAEKTKICIDVASKNELESALDCGFSGEDIGCTGIKNEEFIKKSLEKNCLIVIDSISEFNLVKKLKLSKKPRLAFRINNPFSSSGTFKRKSKFGIQKEEFLRLVESNEMADFVIEGLHIHFYEYVPENKARMISELLSLYKYLYSHNIHPININIGGGYLYPLVDLRHKNSILEKVEKINFEDHSYAKTLLGVKKGRNGKINKTLIVDKLFPDDTVSFLEKVFDSDPSNKSLLEELNLSLYIEPGRALLDNCGIIIMRVLGTKIISEGRKGVIVDGNMYNISSQMREWLTDPIHISKSDNTTHKNYEGFILGNLCKEDDVLIDRKIFLEHEPQLGDLLIFFNTAGYAGSFEDTDAIQQPKNKNYVYLHKDQNPVIISEKEYLEEKE